MQLFLDTAQVDEVRKAVSWGVIHGVTTNPSLMQRAGTSNLERVTIEICELVQGPVSAEVISTDPVGNTARSATLELILDTTAPLVYNHFPADTYVHTTSTIELYVNGDDLDALERAVPHPPRPGAESPAYGGCALP